MNDAFSHHQHATVVAIGRGGVAIIGASGSGKSDLALRLIDRGAVLVGDDYVAIGNERNLPIARAVPNLAGKMEVRSLGILAMDYLESAPIRLCVALGQDGERYPDQWPTELLSGFEIPALKLDPFTASAPIKVELALQSLVDADHWPVPISVGKHAQ